MAEVWDEQAKDFTAVAVPAGLTAPFAVNLSLLTMALQPRGGAIKLNGLIGAFRELLSRDKEQWQIIAPTKETSYEEWRDSVDRVTSVRFRLRKPNPHWRDTPDLEAVLEQAEAEVARMELHSDDGIDTESSFVKQSQRHVERGYGEFVYVGVRYADTPDAIESVFNSSLDSEEQAIELPADEHGEVTSEALGKSLADELDVRDNRRHDPQG